MEITRQKIHSVLAHSYLAYFIASLIGLFIDSFMPVYFNAPFAPFITIGCFIIGPFLVLWAQQTSSQYASEQESSKGYFHRGPYRYMRNPTHVGLLILVSGYTVISGSLFFFGMTFIGFLVSNIFFTRYESILDTTYGEQYQQYQSKVPKIL